MKKHFKFVLVMLVVLALAALTACSNGKSNNAASGKKTYSFAFLPNTQNNTYQAAMNTTFEKLAKEHGYKYTMLNPDYDLSKQLNQMSDAANQGFDAVFVIPVDSSGLRQGLEQFKTRNIPVFNVDTAVTKDDQSLVQSIIATNAYMAGQLEGQQMAKDYPNGGKIAILDFPENQSCVDRVNGFLNGLGANKSKFQIVAQEDGKATLDASLPIAQDIIQAHPDIKAFFAINDPSSLGVVAAIKATGRKDIGVYSIDASPDGKKALVDGTLKSDAAQVPIQIATTAFNEAVNYLKGQKVQKEVYLPSHLVTLDMAKATAGQWQ